MNLPGLNDPFSAETQRRLIQAVRELALGGTHAAGGFALAEGQTQTMVTNRECAETSLPMPVPCSPAAAIAAWWIASVENGQFTVGHTVAPAGAVFRYELRQPS